MLKQKLNLRHEPDKYISRDNAFNSLSHYVKPHRVMMGDAPYFWVVCPSDAERLFKMGYEYAE